MYGQTERMVYSANDVMGIEVVEIESAILGAGA